MAEVEHLSDVVSTCSIVFNGRCRLGIAPIDLDLAELYRRRGCAHALARSTRDNESFATSDRRAARGRRWRRLFGTKPGWSPARACAQRRVAQLGESIKAGATCEVARAWARQPPSFVPKGSPEYFRQNIAVRVGIFLPDDPKTAKPIHSLVAKTPRPRVRPKSSVRPASHTASFRARDRTVGAYAWSAGSVGKTDLSLEIMLSGLARRRANNQRVQPRP